MEEGFDRCGQGGIVQQAHQYGCTGGDDQKQGQTQGEIFAISKFFQFSFAP